MTAAPPPATTHSNADGSPRRLGLALAVICVAQLMVVLDATVMNVALPSIRHDLGFSATSLEWVITAYSLTFGGLLLFGGRTGDLFGRRRMFMVGIGIFALSSLVGGLAQNEAALIIARAAQGIGGAIAAPTALALIATMFAEGTERNRAFGIYAAMAASGGALGLLLGGALTDYASWRWALFINAPIGLAVLLLSPRVLVDSRGSGKALDVPGAITATLGMGSLVYGFSNAATHAWSSTGTLVALGLSAVLLASFVLVEMRATSPLLPLRILANRNRSGAYLVMLFLAGGMFATFFFTTQFLQVVHGWSPVRTGLGFLPMPATIMFMSMFGARRLIPRIGIRPLLFVGPPVASAGMFVLSQLTTSSSYLHVLGGLLPLAFGMGCCFVPLTLTAVADVPHHESGLASALLNTGQQLGGAVGLSVLGTVAAHAGRSRAGELAGRSHAPLTTAMQHDVFVHAQSVAYYGAAISMALAFVVSATMIRVKRAVTPVEAIDEVAQDLAGEPAFASAR